MVNGALEPIGHHAPQHVVNEDTKHVFDRVINLLQKMVETIALVARMK